MTGGVRLRGVQQTEARTGRGAEHDTGMRARRVHDVEDVVEHVVRAVDVPHGVDHSRELVRRGDGFDLVERVDAAGTVEDLALGVAVGPTERADDREPVELALGKRERTRAPERVLRRDEEERLGQRVRRRRRW